MKWAVCGAAQVNGGRQNSKEKEEEEKIKITFAFLLLLKLGASVPRRVL
jgi:hypothetical protein